MIVDPETRALRDELKKLQVLEEKEELKAEIERLRKKHGKQDQKALSREDQDAEFWAQKGVKCTNLRPTK